MRITKSILVVGAGTAGLISAIILKKKLDVRIDVVFSKTIGIIGVGEGSTEHWKEFMDYAGIDHHALIRETDATYKSGIMFENWAEKSYLHSVGTPFNYKAGQYNYIYAKQISENAPVTPTSFWENKIDKNFLNNQTQYPANQFHFNTYRLNEFLIKFAKSLDIGFIEDDILDIVCDSENGYIQKLIGIKQQYDYDFFIDCTGFSRKIIGSVGGKWKSYSRYLKMKSAITFQTPDEDNYNYWTLARAMDYGWMFRIPVWGRYGNGYIYDSDYISADQAKIEAEKYLNRELEIGKQFNFDPGALEECWIKNCCAIGVSANFVEPLEASSIGTTIQQSFLLMHYIGMYDEISINKYNSSVAAIMENIRDFVSLHYITRKDHTDFWIDLKQIEIPDSLKSNLEKWRHKLPIQEDFSYASKYILFNDVNFIMVMEGLELFDRSSIRKEYHTLHKNIRDQADYIVNNHAILDRTLKKLDHKTYIEIVRNFL